MFYLSYKIECQTLSERAALIHHFTQDEFPSRRRGRTHLFSLLWEDAPWSPRPDSLLHYSKRAHFCHQSTDLL